MLIDTHCHLHDPEFFTPEQQAEFLADAHARGVEQIICIGTNPDDSKTAADFAKSHENVFWTYGIHPEFASDYVRTDLCVDDLLDKKLFQNNQVNTTEEDTAYDNPGLSDDIQAILSEANILSEKLKRARAERAEGVPCKDRRTTGLREKNVSFIGYNIVAIGEIGLDYHYDGYDRSAQICLFEQMLQLAINLSLPVSLHVREAFSDAFAVLDNFPKIRGVVHSFTGSKRELRTALERGFYIGVNGLATYSTLPLPPLDRILLETDAPFLTPKPFRGTINQPGYVELVAQYLADKMGVAINEITEQTTQNARQLFRI